MLHAIPPFRLLLRTSALAAFGAGTALLLVSGGLAHQPMLWLIVLVAAGTFAVTLAEHGPEVVGEALLATLRHPRTPSDRDQARLAWVSVSRLAVPTGAVWGLCAAVAVGGSVEARVVHGALALAYGMALAALAVDMEERLAGVEADAPMGSGGLVLSGLGPVTVLPALALLGLVLSA